MSVAAETGSVRPAVVLWPLLFLSVIGAAALLFSAESGWLSTGAGSYWDTGMPWVLGGMFLLQLILLGGRGATAQRQDAPGWSRLIVASVWAGIMTWCTWYGHTKPVWAFSEVTSKLLSTMGGLGLWLTFGLLAIYPWWTWTVVYGQRQSFWASVLRWTLPIAILVGLLSIQGFHQYSHIDDLHVQ